MSTVTNGGLETEEGLKRRDSQRQEESLDVIWGSLK